MSKSATSIFRTLNPPELPAVDQSARRIDWVISVIVFQIICQLALLSSVFGSLRVPLRTASFAVSLGLLAILPKKGKMHPSATPALVALTIVALAVFHPTTNTLIAGVAQLTLYAAIFSPLFWMPRAHVDEGTLRRIITVIWIYGSLSACFGVLQIYFPGTFDFNISSALLAPGDWYVEDLKITLANGMRVFRPMGLTDTPGGAASGGFYAILLSMGLLAFEKRIWMKAACIAAIPVGLFCLYLCQVRSILVMSLFCVVAFLFLMCLRGEGKRVMGMVALLLGVIVLSLIWAVSVGGDSATKRLISLVDDRPGDVYYANRGQFLEETIKELLPQYMLGAGLGRWGMINAYFGDNSNPDRAAIWAEIQWTGWVLDGGFPLVAAYVTAIAMTFFVAWRCVADRSSGAIGLWGALIMAYNFGMFATTFNNPVFIGQGGLEFWLLNSALFAAYQNSRNQQISLPMKKPLKGVAR